MMMMRRSLACSFSFVQFSHFLELSLPFSIPPFPPNERQMYNHYGQFFFFLVSNVSIGCEQRAGCKFTSQLSILALKSRDAALVRFSFICSQESSLICVEYKYKYEKE